LKKIKDIPASDRPREKMQQKGAAALSDYELLAVLLGSGTKKHDVVAVAERILKSLDGKKELSLDELKKSRGLARQRPRSLQLPLSLPGAVSGPKVLKSRSLPMCSH
jgi:DNA repair protein RadC